MPKTSDIVMGQEFFALFIGLTGSGKTLAGASFPGPIHFFDFDKRMQPVRLYYPERDDITYDNYNVSNFESFVTRTLPDLVKYCPYRLVQLAGITSLTHLAITYQMAHKDKQKKTGGGLSVPSWDEFNGEAMFVGQVLDYLKSVKCNVIVEAHPVARLNANSGVKYTSLAAFGPKVESLIPGYFNEVYYFASETDITGRQVRKVYTRPTDIMPLAKTSLPLPSEFTVSDEDGKPLSLYSLIQAELDKHNIKLETKNEVIENNVTFPVL